jgi:phage terminase large subunit-like protein
VTPSPGPSQGGLVCAWIEEHCVLGEGDYFGEKYKLRPWQQEFIWDLYEQNPDGSRRYRSALLGLPRGNGKTALIAAIGVYELCGGSHVSPLVTVAAASFEQADLVFGDMKHICRSSPTLAPTVDVLDTEILLKGRPGRAYRVAAAAGTNEGQRPTCFIADELHAWEGSKARVHLILANGCAKRQDAFTLNISTAGYDPESLLGRMYEHGQQVAAGEVDDRGFLFRWRQADANIEPKTREEWRQAVLSCNPACGDFLDTESVVSRCMEIPLGEAKRYHLNLFSVGETIWEVAGLWEGLKSDLELDPALPIYAGLDVATIHDSSAVVWCQKLAGKYVLRAKVWDNPYPFGTRMHDEWRFEIAEVKEFCRELFKQYPASAITDEKGKRLPGPAFIYDPNRFVESAQEMAADGMSMVEFPQHESRLIPMSQAFFEFAKEGLLAHDGNPDLARHIRAVVATQKARGWRISKPSHGRANIDGAMAAGMACYVASQQPAPPPEPRIRIFELGVA